MSNQLPYTFPTYPKADPLLVKARCLELGMPEEVWGQCLQDLGEFTHPQTPHTGPQGRLIGIPDMPMQKDPLEKGYFKQYHPNVEAAFYRLFPIIRCSYFYITDDPAFQSLLCNDADSFARATNHYEGLIHAEIRNFTQPRLGRPPNPNKVTQASTAKIPLTAEQEAQRLLDLQKKAERSVRYSEWLLECEAYRTLIATRQLELKQLEIVVIGKLRGLDEQAKQIKAPLESARLELQILKMGGAPKLKP